MPKCELFQLYSVTEFNWSFNLQTRLKNKIQFQGGGMGVT
jgi:hypothetical protein